MNTAVLILLGISLSHNALLQDAGSGGQTPAPATEQAAPTPPKPVDDGADSADPDSHAKRDSAPVQPPPGAFVIGPEDVLYIRVLHEQDLTGPQDVRPDGMISLQLVGAVKAAGLTPEQLSATIREKLLETMKNPEVSVQVTKINSRKYTIQGEVRRPGTYNFGTPITILEALGNGQGFSDFANVKKIYILRNGQKLAFNYKDVSHGKHPEQNILVQNGDQIFVP